MQHRLHENENCLTFFKQMLGNVVQSVPMVSSGGVAEESRFLLVGQHGTASSNTTSSHNLPWLWAGWLGDLHVGPGLAFLGFALSTANHPHWFASMISPTASPI